MECLRCFAVVARSPFVRPIKIATCITLREKKRVEQRREDEARERGE